jgi:hypothetical protein
MAIQEQGTGNGERANEPQLGIPYPGPAYGYPAATVTTAPPQQMPPQYYAQQNPYAAGMRPPNAIYGPPLPGMTLQDTFFADTRAPFECPHCGKPGLTNVKYVGSSVFPSPPLQILSILKSFWMSLICAPYVLCVEFWKRR